MVSGAYEVMVVRELVRVAHRVHFGRCHLGSDSERSFDGRVASEHRRTKENRFIDADVRDVIRIRVTGEGSS